MTAIRERLRRGAPLGMVTLAIMVAAGACNLIKPLDPSLEAGFLTNEADDDYGITLAGSDVVAAAPTTNEGGNTRVAFWPAGWTPSSDQQSCVSWVEDDHFTQQGLALRARSVNGRTTAITVTKNIWYHGFWVYNVHVMDGGNAEQPFTLIASFDVSGAVIRNGAPAPGPWRLCARVDDDAVSVKVWAADQPEPAWMDGVHGGGVMLPAGWDAPGAPGWYVGHLRPGVSTTYTDREAVHFVTPEPTTTSTTETTVPSDPTETTDTTVPVAPPPAEATRRAPATDAGGDTTVPYREPTDIPVAP